MKNKCRVFLFSDRRGKVYSLRYLWLTCLLAFIGNISHPIPATASSEENVMEKTQQTRKVAGNVEDEEGEPIIGASIQIKGSMAGTVTDLDGYFELEVPTDATLVISYVGMRTEEIHPGSRSVLHIVLKDSNIGLDEVIVVGYGTQKKATLTGSVSQIGGEELKKVAAVNLTNSLAGKTAGLIANVRSGEPGQDDADILIRGIGTLGTTNPLIVVDGIADREFSRLNPEDIESISVLKDAAAAIYGARAANGVILVTTKRGRQGKTSINYSGNVSISQPTRIPRMLNSYELGTWINEYDLGHGEPTTYTPDQLEHFRLQDQPELYPDTDWWDVVTNNWAVKTQHSLSISGGTDKISFYTSAQYLYQDAIYKNSPQDFKQYQFITNLDAQVTSAIRLSVDILGRQEQKQKPVTNTDDIFTYFLTASPMHTAYYPNGLPRIGFDEVQNNAAVLVTDLPGTSNGTYNTFNMKPRIRIDLDKLTSGLYMEGYAALDFKFNKNKTLQKPYDLFDYDTSTGEYINRRDATGAISVKSWSSDTKTITLNARIGYSKQFNQKHSVDAFIAYEQSKYNYNYVEASRTNYLSTEIPEINAGSADPQDKNNAGYSNVTARQNYFGRINYSYMDKYLAEFTMRYDGSMNFAPGHRWGVFPAFSLGWVLSEEDFFEPFKNVVNFLKLKGSWGMMGNDNIDAYQYLSLYEYTSTNSYFGETVVKGLSEYRVANPLVTWEKAKTWNIGFNSQFLDGKIGLDIDYFQSRRNDILIARNASIPIYAGFSLPSENIGKVNNKGVEIIANYNDRKGDFNWGVTGNFTYAKNKIIYSDEAADTPEWKRATGYPSGGLVLYKALGIYQTQEEVDASAHILGAKPGDLIYQDTNQDGQITEDDMIRIHYSRTPRIIYGLTLDGSWKGIDINIFFQGQAQAKQLLMPTMNLQHDFYEGRWIETNTAEENLKAKWPRAHIKSTEADAWNKQQSTWWLRNAGFLRLKSVEVGYSLPKHLISKAHVENIRIYVNGNNLLTFDKIKISDPEAASYKDVDGRVNDSGGIRGYPIQRLITFGANITF